ncbi:Thiol peroxidase, Bcp-type [Labilithrix luteola]|uniref:thioredoxin-dependent peroxiredoxin n=1 Tax=Labilithrix luteola TaxID=1391654 RepID=A0A0K1PV86_9BACT|nr:Thiol peroxidase, Bcp-type [Labilithrix luteola]
MKGTSVLAGLVLVGVTSCGSAPTKATEPPKAPVSADAKPHNALAAGMTAPDFVAPGHDGQRVTPSGYRGRTLILFFYTRTGTPNDTREACDFRDRAAELRERGIAVVGVSTDDVDAQKSFAKLHRFRTSS